MNTNRRCAWFSSCLLATLTVGFAACSDEENKPQTPTDMAAPPADQAPVADLVPSPSVDQNPAPDLAGDGGAVACTSPADCGGNPCCITVQQQMLQGIVCTAAPSDCAPAVDFSGSGQTRACRNAVDCSSGLMSTVLPDCCTGTRNGSSIQLCFSKELAPFTMGQIVCP